MDLVLEKEDVKAHGLQSVGFGGRRGSGRRSVSPPVLIWLISAASAAGPDGC